MAAKGLPDKEELALLEPYREKLPPEVFGEPYTPPVSDGSGQDRSLLRKANELLLAAGEEVGELGHVLRVHFCDPSQGT